MSKPETLEEAWARLVRGSKYIVGRSEATEALREEVRDAARALALAAFKMGVYTKTACGHTWNDEDAERRRIEALGR